MIESVTTGNPLVQIIPAFTNTYTSQGRGSCGDQIYSITQTDGSLTDSFLTLSGDQLTLQSSDESLIGEYSIRLTVTLQDYTNVQATTDFTVRLLILDSGPSFVAS